MIDLQGELKKIESIDNNETYDRTTDSLEALRNFLATWTLINSGMWYYGVVTAVPGANQFTVVTLAGLGAGIFDFVGGEGYRAFVLRDAGGVSAAPQGEFRNVTAYDTATGTFTTDAFTAAVAVGDEIVIINPRLAESQVIAARGGVETLESLDDEMDAMLDLAQVRTLASPVTLTAALQYVYQSTPGTPFYFCGGFMKRVTGAWAGGETVTINVDIMIDGVNWNNIWTITFAAEPAPVLAAIPAHANSALLNLPYGFYNNGNGVRVGVIQNAVGAGFHTWAHSFLDCVRST